MKQKDNFEKMYAHEITKILILMILDSENIYDYDFFIIVSTKRIYLCKIIKNKIQCIEDINGYPISVTNDFVNCIKNCEHKKFISESKFLLV